VYIKLAAVLKFFAQGSYQEHVGETYYVGLSQPGFSKILTEMLNIFERHICGNWISFRKNEVEKREAKEHFFTNYEFPGVIGCVDGTHVSLIRPSENEHLFYGKEGHHTMNVMVVSNFYYILHASCNSGATQYFGLWMKISKNFIKLS
jgi:hypothetical protein